MRRIADTLFGTPLGGDIEFQVQRPGMVTHHRHPDQHLLVERFDPAEVFILLFLATGDEWRTQLDVFRIGTKAEFILIQIIAIGNLEAHFEGLAIQRLQRGAEGQRWWQEILGGRRQRKQQGQQGKQASDHGQRCQRLGLASSLTQVR